MHCVVMLLSSHILPVTIVMIDFDVEILATTSLCSHSLAKYVGLNLG